MCMSRNGWKKSQMLAKAGSWHTESCSDTTPILCISSSLLHDSGMEWFGLLNGSKYRRKFELFRAFDYLIVCCILLNSLTLALYDYSDPNNEGVRNQVMETLGLVFTVIFTAEAAMKIFGMGMLLHPRSYMRDAWNVVDFLIVVAG